MKEIKCKVLYKVPINLDLLKELIELGRLFEKRSQIITVIDGIEDVSEELRYKWSLDYNKEWHESAEALHEQIRKKLNLEDEKHLLTYNLGAKEVIVLDILKTEYERICKKNHYMVNVIYE